MKKSNSKTFKIQRIIDNFWQIILLPFIPEIITPNKISILRLLIIPIIIFILFKELYLMAICLFIVTALLDSLDGALARKRKQFSDWGLILDPLSDKLLIIGVLFFLLFHYPLKELIIVLIVLEFLIILLSIIQVKNKNKLKTSNIWGKLKMVLQSLSVVLIIAWLIYPLFLILMLSIISISFSILFQIISFLSYIYPRDLTNKKK